MVSQGESTCDVGSILARLTTFTEAALLTRAFPRSIRRHGFPRESEVACRLAGNRPSDPPLSMDPRANVVGATALVSSRGPSPLAFLVNPNDARRCRNQRYSRAKVSVDGLRRGQARRSRAGRRHVPIENVGVGKCPTGLFIRATWSDGFGSPPPRASTVRRVGGQ